LQDRQGIQELRACLADTVCLVNLDLLEPQGGLETPAIRDLRIWDRLELALADIEVQQELKDMMGDPEQQVGYQQCYSDNGS